MKTETNLANGPTIRPLRFSMVVAAVAAMVVAAVVEVAAVVVLLVVEESHGMILCLKKVRFSHLLKTKRRDRPAHGPTDGRTDKTLL